MSQRVTVIGPNLPVNGESFHVHRAGCRDIARSRVYNRVDRYTFTARNLAEVAEDVFCDQIAEDSMTIEQGERDIKVYPCVTFNGVTP